MNAKNSSLTVFNANPFVLFSVFFTVSMAINMVMWFFFAEEPLSIGVSNILTTAIFCGAPVVALVLFDIVPGLKYLNHGDCSLWISIPVHFLVSLGLILFAVFVWGRIEPLPAAAYLNTALMYALGYTVITVGAAIIDLRKTAAANRNLKKIQKSQK